MSMIDKIKKFLTFIVAGEMIALVIAIGFMDKTPESIKTEKIVSVYSKKEIDKKSFVEKAEISIQEKFASLDKCKLANILLHRESSNNYRAINSRGFIGGYQFGVAMLEDLKILKKGSFERMKKLKVSQKVFIKKYAKWNKGLSLKKFLNNKKLQDDLFVKSLAKNFHYLQSKGVLSHETSRERLQGLLFAAHLKGAESVKQWLNGTLVKDTDAYGTKIGSYYDLGFYA